eukprot:CAMPEP_0181084834 /NCGR_PEP_ID=MMETSP1071-20121207/4905_1 /TAXON_ID=35127 /ORGANISM="Thalassiosira sp., Strain NH16" /LENGTH=117 /DNA_ID=CAMNT_0023166591 /DNA_START=498 /DNA_END=848 /DNA_ORIENTATION=-
MKPRTIDPEAQNGIEIGKIATAQQHRPLLNNYDDLSAATTKKPLKSKTSSLLDSDGSGGDSDSGHDVVVEDGAVSGRAERAQDEDWNDKRHRGSNRLTVQSLLGRFNNCGEHSILVC